jgi:crotonobetainyl-CoA:carnitine CoA-transferase CaiB-like acyl-CoA transferase
MVLRCVTPRGEVPMTGIVPKFSRTPGDVTATGPALGQHSEPVLRSLAGVDDAEWGRLVAAGVV